MIFFFSSPAHVVAFRSRITNEFALLVARAQTDPTKYKSIMSGFSVTVKEQGMAGLVRGWAPTLFGYSAQGAFKYGLYEYFKKYYTDLAGPETAAISDRLRSSRWP